MSEQPTPRPLLARLDDLLAELESDQPLSAPAPTVGQPEQTPTAVNR